MYIKPFSYLHIWYNAAKPSIVANPIIAPNSTITVSPTILKHFYSFNMP